MAIHSKQKMLDEKKRFKFMTPVRVIAVGFALIIFIFKRDTLAHHQKQQSCCCHNAKTTNLN